MSQLRLAINRVSSWRRQAGAWEVGQRSCKEQHPMLAKSVQGGPLACKAFQLGPWLVLPYWRWTLQFSTRKRALVLELLFRDTCDIHSWLAEQERSRQMMQLYRLELEKFGFLLCFSPQKIDQKKLIGWFFENGSIVFLLDNCWLTCVI